jgi:uncharacterized membrane protein YdbT with pleckstrin-like domain
LLENLLMSYVDEILQPGETVRHIGKLHWILYVPGCAPFALAILLFFVFHASSIPRGLALVLLAICILSGAVLLLGAWIRRWTTEIVITDRRVILKSGFISRRTLEMNMTKVESVDVIQGILGRMLNFGTVVIRGIGAGIEPLRDVERPIELRNAVTS